jgi:hypothetical protein
VDELSPLEARDAALIVAGGPTHAHGIARANAHQSVAKLDAKHHYPAVLPGDESLRGWLERMPAGRTLAASFDTRFHKPKWLTGSAAKKIASRLRGKGYSVIGSRASSSRRQAARSRMENANEPSCGVVLSQRR